MNSGPVGIGFIGTGMISDTYLENLAKFPDVRLVILGDLDAARARARAEKHGVPEWGEPEAVLSHPDVELVVNLTVPTVHAKVSSDAIAAGKHVWSEKPISVDRQSALALLTQADDTGILIGVAPDTVLGPGIQTARRAIARGDIGVPLSAQTVMQYPGPDLFHPDPEFLFSQGGGPLFDFGPYYLTTLAHIFGPFATVAAFASKGRDTRMVQVGDRTGTTFPVDVPTHVSMIAQFVDGGIGQCLFSFDSPLARMGIVEITGTDGTLVVPDPNQFTGQIKITRAATPASLARGPMWEVIPLTGVTAGRGTGVLDLARSIRSGSRPLASGALAYHILDTLLAVDEAARTGRTVEVRSRVDPVPLLPDGWDPFAPTGGMGSPRREEDGGPGDKESTGS